MHCGGRLSPDLNLRFRRRCVDRAIPMKVLIVYGMLATCIAIAFPVAAPRRLIHG